MVLVTLPELKGPVPRLVAREPRMPKVIRGVHEGPDRRIPIRAGPRHHADVPTLEGVGCGRPPPPVH